NPTVFGEIKLKRPIQTKEALSSYLEYFSGSSLFRLKRVLGEEALKLVWQLRKSPEDLALWYANWVTHMAEKKINFGLVLRNKPDEKFHYQWAMHTPVDRIEWEILNRYHRMLNY